MMEIMMMEIMVSCRWRWWSWSPEDGDQKEQNDIGHIMSLYDLHVMFIMFTSYLLRTTVAYIRWSLTKISRKCSP